MANNFSELAPFRRETLLMETAMRIMEVFRDMLDGGLIDKDCIYIYDSNFDSLEQLLIFSDWAREFENTYYGTEKYENDFIDLSEEFAVKKLTRLYGKGR